MSNVRLELGDFSPDLDLVVQGFSRKQIPQRALALLSDSQWVYSTTGGFTNMPALQAQSSPLPSKVVGAYGAEVGGAFIVVEGTYNQLYLNIDGLLVNQNLTLANTQNPWYFTVYGNDLLATNGADPVQVSINGGHFAALAGSPPLFSIVEATPFSLFGVVPNSNQYYFTLNDTIWTPSIATSTGTAILGATSGIIRAAKQLRGGIAMFKHNSLYYGQFAGPPLFWDFTVVSTQVGTYGPHSVVAVDTTLYFVGPDDFWMFDGYSLQRMPNNLKKFFFNDLDSNFAGNIFATYDVPRSQIFFYYPSVNAFPLGSLDSYVSYSLRTGKWLRGSINIDTPLDGQLFASSPWTWGRFQDTYVSYSGIPALIYGAALFSGNTNSQYAVVDSSHTLQAFNGTGTDVAFIQTGDLGDKMNMYRITRARPGFLQYPAANSRTKMQTFGTYNQGSSLGAKTVVQSSQIVPAVLTLSHQEQWIVIQVNSTAGFAASGTINVGGQAISYDSISGNTIIGSPGSNSIGVVPAGTVVTQGGDYIGNNPVALSPQGFFDFVSTNRLQRLRLQWDEDAEVADMDVTIDFVGSQ